MVQKKTVARRKIDPDEALKAAQLKESDRGPVTLYLSRQLFEDFKKFCGIAPPSKVIEELMWQCLHPPKRRK